MNATLPTRISMSVSIWESVYVNTQAWHATRTRNYNGAYLGNEARFIFIKKGIYFQYFRRSAAAPRALSYSWFFLLKIRASPLLSRFLTKPSFRHFCTPPRTTKMKSRCVSEDTDTSQPPCPSVSVSVSQCQSVSVSVSQRQSVSVSVSQCQSVSVSVSQCQSG